MRTFPEHERLVKVSSTSQEIGEFLDWLPTVGVELAVIDRESFTDDRLQPCHRTIPSLLAEYFEIDQKKIDAEKEAMLEVLRNG